MIHKIYSDLPTFKNLSFNPGLNILLADKMSDSSDKQTRNRSGKTTLIEIIHFLMGAECNKDSLFREDELIKFHFNLDFDLIDKIVLVERSGKSPSKIIIKNAINEDISNSDWKKMLGDNLFKFNSFGHEIPDKYRPTFRSLFSYFARREREGGFTFPTVNGVQQQLWDQQIAVSFLLGLDWTLSQEWQIIRDKEKTLKELKKAAGSGLFGDMIGTVAKLRTELAISEENFKKISSITDNFNVLPEYKEYELEANKLKKEISELSDQNLIDNQMIAEFENSISLETPPSTEDLDMLYDEVKITLPDNIKKRFDEVKEFHNSIIENRKFYLSNEIEEARNRIKSRDESRLKLNQRKAEVMSILKSHGALEEYDRLLSEKSKLEVETNTTRKKFEAAQQLEGEKNKLDIERKRLLSRLQINYKEQKDQLNKAVVLFQQISRSLYGETGSLMTVQESENGPVFDFPIQGKGSRGILNMQIFCFDMTLMILSSERDIGPKFLIHDSHLFDGVDERQIARALELGFEFSKKYKFQYIVTLNSDNLPIGLLNFDYQNCILPTRLTDSQENGGLLGMRISNFFKDEKLNKKQDNPPKKIKELEILAPLKTNKKSK